MDVINEALEAEEAGTDEDEAGREVGDVAGGMPEEIISPVLVALDLLAGRDDSDTTVRWRCLLWLLIQVLNCS